MATRCLLVLFFFASTLISAVAQNANRYAIEIDLQDQMAYLLENGRLVLTTPISSGRGGHFTGRGVFKIIEKERNHYSNMYGKIVDARGRTVVADADADMAVSRGGKFIPAPMRYFMRFNGATGMHAGFLPGYAASHGCVRLPEAKAIALFETVPIGTPVTVFGTTARGRAPRERGITMRQRPEPREDYWLDPRQDPRFVQPAWWR